MGPVLADPVVLRLTGSVHTSADFRILIGPQGRDRGLGTEAVQLITNHAFRTTGLWRIGLEVCSFNPRARRVYERAGFVAEGVLRGALRFDDDRVDAVVMSLLRSDWEAELRGPEGRLCSTAATMCPMETVGLPELRQNASELIRRAEAGEEIDIMVSGRLVARLVPAAPKQWFRWDEIADLLQGRADPDWKRDRDLVDQSVVDPWESRR